MKTPSFWYRKKGLRARMLAPLGQLYRAATLLRRAGATPYKASVPVICIGNIVAGGAGKTPTAVAVAALLIKEGKRVVFVSRGYGGNEKGPLLVDPAKHTARDVGDEALLLAKAAPCWIGRQRAAAVQAAEKDADIIILDDGLQNPKVAADVNVLVIDGGAGLGNECLIPAGPLRETMNDALPRIHGVVMIGKDHTGFLNSLKTFSNKISIPTSLTFAPAGFPHIINLMKQGPRFPGDNERIVTDVSIIHATLRPALPASLIGAPKVLAFAGIGRPQKFYDSCRAAGLTLCDTQDFPDHYMFTETDLAALKSRAETQGLQLITTAKDFVRLPDPFRANVTVLDITLVFEDTGTIKEGL